MLAYCQAVRVGRWSALTDVSVALFFTLSPQLQPLQFRPLISLCPFAIAVFCKMRFLATRPQIAD